MLDAILCSHTTIGRSYSNGNLNMKGELINELGGLV